MLNLIWIPFVTAFIGWLTNWFAIKMLFKPLEPKRILGIKTQGLIPRRKEELAETIAELVEKELINQHLIQAKVKAIDLSQYTDELCERMVRQSLAEKLQSIPFIGSMINDSTLKMLENMAKESMSKEIGPLQDKVAQDLEESFQVRELVYSRIRAFDLEKLEKIVAEIARKEFKTIERIGAILGFIIGIAQVVILEFV